MTTHRTEDLAAGDVTTWLRDEATGLVTNKVYADGMGPAYGYTPDGRPTRTTWARGAWFENVYDGQGRVVQVLHDDATLDAALEYDALGRPVARNADAFGYDALGQVVSARFDEDAAPDLYAYDFIGNFTSNRLRNAWTQFEANELNEYVSITNHPNHPNHLTLSYDYDGNLLTNGVWSYAYDSHNRLTTVWSNDVFVLENRYDFASRRILKRTPIATHRYCYDGWNPVCELVVSGNATNRVDYFWGKDLSGTLQGAGGVGGLLAVRKGGDSFYPAYDNNGNISAYAGATGAVVAFYAYDTFGNMLSASGPLASVFAHRFSTKPRDPETGFYYYGYRFYAPVLGRWMNRDPIEEKDRVNLFQFCFNCPQFGYDVLGLFRKQTDCPKEFIILFTDAETAAKQRLERWINLLKSYNDATTRGLLMEATGEEPSLGLIIRTKNKLEAFQNKLEQLVAAINDKQYDIECECNCSLKDGEPRDAYVNRLLVIFEFDSSIHICPGLIAKNDLNITRDILVHELSHFLWGTEDLKVGEAWEFSGNFEAELDLAAFYQNVCYSSSSQSAIKDLLVQWFRKALKGKKE